MLFERDDAKAAANQRKHGVTFDEAEAAFADEHGLLLADPDHSDHEDRFALLGASSTRLLVVCHCYRAGKTIRIFSARPANKRERAVYRERTS